MNRAIEPAAAGEYVLRAGRRYRLLLVVNGSTSCDALEEALSGVGFNGAVASSPDDWRQAPADGGAPPDWPKEPHVEPAANECLVRASGVLAPDGGIRQVSFVRDERIAGGEACYTIVGAWDYGPARRMERTGEAPSSSSSSSGSESSSGNKLLVGGIMAGLGFGAWSLLKKGKQQQKDEERLLKLERARERLALEEQMRELAGAETTTEKVAAVDRAEAEDRALDRMLAEAGL